MSARPDALARYRAPGLVPRDPRVGFVIALAVVGLAGALAALVGG